MQTKEWLYRIQPTRLAMLTEGPTEYEAVAMIAHFQYLQELTEAGTVVLAGPTLITDENNFGIVIFRAEDEHAARHIMQNDPAVEGGVMDATLFPFRISLHGGA